MPRQLKGKRTHRGHQRRVRRGDARRRMQDRRTRRQQRAGRPPAPRPAPGELRIPTLEEEIARLAAHRDQVTAAIDGRIEECKIPELLRYLSVLTQTGRGLAAMLAQRAAGGGVSEIDDFFAQVAARVQGLADEGYHVVGHGRDPLALLLDTEDGDGYQEPREDADRPDGGVGV